MSGQPIASQRIYSIDILRGVVMILMALDHVRDFFHETASLDSPTNLATTTPALFFTRWITHFCAPTFVLLAGISAYMMGQKRTKAELGHFLIKRGCWLILVEVVLISFALTFNPFYNMIILQVIWAIGISMIILGLFVRLPYQIVLITGISLICFHNLLDYPEAVRSGQVGFFWDLLHHGNFSRYRICGTHEVAIIYAFMPWTGIMMLGYGIGKVFGKGFSGLRRRKILFSLGAALLIIFLGLRLVNAYGDPVPWSVQPRPLYSLLSFLNVMKYPPSLDYTGLTVGVALIMLGLLDRMSGKKFLFFKIFGAVPFFYYVVHFYLIHLLTVLFFIAEKFPASEIIPKQSPFFFRPDQFGFNLWIVYLIWALVVLMVYPLCRWYGRYKASHDAWWLGYL